MEKVRVFGDFQKKQRGFMNRSGESMAEEKNGKNVNSVSAQGGMGKSREPEVDSEGGPNNELNALRNAATRSTTGQDGFKGKPDPKKNTYGTSHIDDYHKQVNDHLLQNGTKPSDIAYNYEGKPIVTYDAMGNPVAIPPGDYADSVKKLGDMHAKREQNKADGVFSKMFSGMSDATASIAAGLDGVADKSIEGIGRLWLKVVRRLVKLLGRLLMNLRIMKSCRSIRV